MAFRHGKSAVILYNEFNLSPYFNAAGVSNDLDMAETSTFGATAKTFIPGLIDGKVSAAGLFDGDADAVDEVLSAVMGAEDSDIVTVCPEGNSLGRRAYSMLVKQASYKISAPVTDAVKTSVELQCDGGADSSVILAAGAAVSTTGNGTGVDQDAASTGGGVGYLHVPVNTRDGAVTVKIQHSTDNVTFADLITFAAVPASTPTVERLVVSGTVNRYVRAQHTIAGATGSTTYTATFSRR